MAGIGGQALVHTGLAVAVGADDVVPPLVAELMRDEVFDEAAGNMRRRENALINHDQSGALVAVPAEVGLDDGELGVRIRPKPAFVDRKRLAGPADHFARIMRVLGQSQTAYWLGSDLGGERLETGTADPRE